MRQMMPQNFQMAGMASPMRNNYDQRRNQYNFMSPQNVTRGGVDQRQMRSPQIPPTNYEDSKNYGKENVFQPAQANHNHEWKRMERNSTGQAVDSNLMFNKYREMMMSPQPVSKSKSQNNQNPFRSPQFNSKAQAKYNQYQTLQSPAPNSRGNVLQGNKGVVNKEAGQTGGFPQGVNVGNSNSANYIKSPNMKQNQSYVQGNERNERKTYNTSKNGCPDMTALTRKPKMSVDNQEANTSKYLKYKEQYQNSTNINQQGKFSQAKTSNYNSKAHPQVKHQNAGKGEVPQTQTQTQSQSQYYSQQQQLQFQQNHYNQKYQVEKPMSQTQYQGQQNTRGNSQARSQYPMKNSNYNSQGQAVKNPQQGFSQSMNNDKWEKQKALYMQNQRSPQTQDSQHIQAQKAQGNIQRQFINEEYMKQKKIVETAVAQNQIEVTKTQSNGQIVKGKGFSTSQRPNFKSSKAKIDAMFQKAIERSQALTSKLEPNKVYKVSPEIASQVKDSVKKIVENVTEKIKRVESKEEVVEVIDNKEEIAVIKEKPENGRGIFNYENGEIYEGEWVNGKREGFGILKSSNSVNVYSGDWLNDFFHGQGVLKNNKVEECTEAIEYKDLHTVEDKWTVFEGEFKDGLKDGLGTLTFSNGERFNGKFCKGVVEGEGTFQTVDGDFILGNWVNNILEKTL